MRTTSLSLLSVLLIAGAAHAGTCNSDVPLQWIINPLYVDGASNLIQGDGGGPYVDGQSRVAAHINVCSGTYDATLLAGPHRNMTISFAKILATNSNTPNWAAGGSTVGLAFLNVRNLFFVPAGYDRSMEYTFTTRLGSSLAGGNLGNFPMLNPNQQAPTNEGNPAVSNSPYPNSLVFAHHCPANSNTTTCPNIIHETWFAYPDPSPTTSGTSQTGLPITQVGALVNSGNQGEFSMPFYFTISLLQ